MKLYCVFYAIVFITTFGHTDVVIQTLSQSPRVYLIPDFLTAEECDYLIEQAAPELERSTVLDAKGGTIDQRRTSRGMFFSSNSINPIIHAIEMKIAQLTQTPIENGEGIQVLHYDLGGEYQPHYDYFNFSQPGGCEALSRGGQRIMTFIMYLNTPEAGGETIFPRSEISVSPKKGNALLFYNVTPSGMADPNSFHGGAPVKAGEKWIATKWIRAWAFQ